MKIKLKILLSIFFIILVFIGIYWFVFPIHFLDDNLKYELQRNLNKSTHQNITRSDMYKIQKLDLSNSNIKELDGLQYLQNICTLNLSNNRIVNIKSIKDLNVKYLDLHNNKIKSLPKFQSSSIKILNLSDNEISSIHNLSPLKHLEDLDLSFNNIDTMPVIDLPNLIFLDLTHNNIASTEEVSTYTSLKTLFIGLNNIVDISPLKNLTNLEELHLFGNTTNISTSLSLGFLKNLKVLDVSDTNIEDIIIQ